MSVLEKEIEDRVVQWAKKHGFLTPKVKFVEAGWPDRLFISPQGHMIFIEFKVPGQVPDMLQEYRLEQLRQRGITATWCDSSLEALVVLKAALEPTPVPGASNTADAFPIGSGPISRSRIGEDLYLSGGPQDFVLEETSESRARRGSFTSGVQSVAGRDKEVGRFQQLDLLDPSRWIEGSNACE